MSYHFNWHFQKEKPEPMEESATNTKLTMVHQHHVQTFFGLKTYLGHTLFPAAWFDSRTCHSFALSKTSQPSCESSLRQA